MFPANLGIGNNDIVTLATAHEILSVRQEANWARRETGQVVIAVFAAGHSRFYLTAQTKKGYVLNPGDSVTNDDAEVKTVPIIEIYREEYRRS